MLIDPISHISTNFNEYKQAEASMKRLKKLNLEPIEIKKKWIKVPNLEGEIQFKELVFEYKNNEKVLKDINLKIKKGM